MVLNSCYYSCNYMKTQRVVLHKIVVSSKANIYKYKNTKKAINTKNKVVPTVFTPIITGIKISAHSRSGEKRIQRFEELCRKATA